MVWSATARSVRGLVVVRFMQPGPSTAGRATWATPKLGPSFASATESVPYAVLTLALCRPPFLQSTRLLPQCSRHQQILMAC
eukprot:361988-Chlamydomonas_euryale.AAC.3